MDFAVNNTDLQDIIVSARNEFDKLLDFVTHQPSRQALHEVEQGIFQQLLLLGHTLLKIFLLACGTGNVGSFGSVQIRVTLS